MIDITKKYKTRSGLEVFGLDVLDGSYPYPIRGYIKTGGYWMSDGIYDTGKIHDFDLIEVEEEVPLNIQVGGSHYKNLKIQPIEFITKNNIGFCEGNAIKYLCRHKDKSGIEDLKKARHYIDLLIDLEYSS